MTESQAIGSFYGEKIKKDQIRTRIERLKYLSKKNVHTEFISGLAVTICFSADKNLFCLNSMSPAN